MLAEECSRSGQTKDYSIYIGCFSTKHESLRRKSKDWLARKKDNVSMLIDITIRGLFWISYLYVQRRIWVYMQLRFLWGYRPKLVFTYGKVTLYISTCEADVPLSSVTHCWSCSDYSPGIGVRKITWKLRTMMFVLIK